MTDAYQPRNLAEAMALRLVAQADSFYLARDWASAQPIYRHVVDSQPTLAEAFALALSAGHCEIELADDAALDGWTAAYGPATGGPREVAMAHDMRVRAMELCRQGAFQRASTLLRFIAAADRDTGGTYADGMLTRRSTVGEALRRPDPEPPGVLAEADLDAWPIERTGARHGGKRLLVVRRYGYSNIQHSVFEIMRDTASRLGLTVQEVNSVAHAGAESDGYVAALRERILSFRPHLLIWDELFLSGISAQPAYRDAVAQMLEDVRRAIGVRVVKFYTDVWYVTGNMPGALYAELGRCYDLINHYHPAIRHHGTAAEQDAVFCYIPPLAHAAPTVEPGTVPRAAFVGSLHAGGTPRIVWWAECMRAGLDLDFIETTHSPAQMSDSEYLNLLRRYQLVANFTLRPTGVRIVTGRVFEAAFAGTVLVEEDSVDTRYFMHAGVHYAPFETLPDLAALIPELLADAPRRRTMAAAAQAFVHRYYTGDFYWTGLLNKLFP